MEPATYRPITFPDGLRNGSCPRDTKALCNPSLTPGLNHIVLNLNPDLTSVWTQEIQNSLLDKGIKPLIEAQYLAIEKQLTQRLLQHQNIHMLNIGRVYIVFNMKIAICKRRYNN